VSRLVAGEDRHLVRAWRSAQGRPRELLVALIEVSVAVLPFVLARLVGRFVELLYLGPIAIVLCVVVATLLLRARGRQWSDMGLARPASWGKALLGAVATFGAVVAAALILRGVAQSLGLGQPKLDALFAVRDSRLTLFLFLFPLSWGTAAFGEEMLARGFVLHRLAEVLGASRSAWTLGILVQAVLFGLAHSWQGVTGVLHVTVLGAVLGFACYRAGGNLWPVVLAHGTLDFVTVLLIARSS
jgi:membrane protease YdiL (CAAX protease family)